LLRKRLRQRYPNLPIIIGYWLGTEDERAVPPHDDEAQKVATSLAGAVALVRATAAQLRLSQAV
jgi:hypothetical protein